MPLFRRRFRSLFGNQQPRKEGRLRQEEFDENLFLRLRANNREELCGKIAGINPRSKAIAIGNSQTSKTTILLSEKRVKYYIILSPEELLPSWNPCKEFLGIKSECSHAQAFVSPHSESLCNLHMFAIANLVFWQGFSAIAAAMSISPSQILQVFLLKCKAYLQGLGG